MSDSRRKIEIDEQKTKSLMKNGKISCVTIATFDNNGLTDKKIIEPDDQKSFTEETKFGAASLSKVVFAYLVLKLIQDGKLSKPGESPESGLDRPLCDIVPEFGSEKIHDHPYYKLLTARMVLSHTTGLPIKQGDGRPLQFEFEPGTKYGYSGVAISYLQEVIVKHTGMTFEQLAKKYVFDPCHMTNSSFGDEPHAENSLQTTANDYALFVSEWLKVLPNENELPKEKDKLLVEAFKSQISMITDDWAQRQDLSPQDLQKLGWGLGWGLELDEKGKTTAAFHSGDMDPWRAFVVINLKKKSGVVFFANSKNGLILTDQIIPKNELDLGLNYIFKKYGFTRSIDNNPTWEKDEWREVVKIITINELHLMINSDPIQYTLSMKCDLTNLPRPYVDLIQNEFNDFKMKNDGKNFRFLFNAIIENDEQKNILKIIIPNKDQYEQFIKHLNEKKLLPIPLKSESEIQNTSAFNPTPFSKNPIPKGTKM